MYLSFLFSTTWRLLIHTKEKKNYVFSPRMIIALKFMKDAKQ